MQKATLFITNIILILLLSIKETHCTKEKIGLIEVIPLDTLVPYELEDLFQYWHNNPLNLDNITQTSGDLVQNITNITIVNSTWNMDLTDVRKSGRMITLQPGNFSSIAFFKWHYYNKSGDIDMEGMGLVDLFSESFTMMKQFTEKDGKLLADAVLSCMLINNGKINFGIQNPPGTWFEDIIQSQMIPSLQENMQNQGYDFLQEQYNKNMMQQNLTFNISITSGQAQEFNLSLTQDPELTENYYKIYFNGSSLYNISNAAVDQPDLPLIITNEQRIETDYYFTGFLNGLFMSQSEDWWNFQLNSSNSSQDFDFTVASLSQILPGLQNDFEADDKVVFNFAPSKKGSYAHVIKEGYIEAYLQYYFNISVIESSRNLRENSKNQQTQQIGRINIQILLQFYHVQDQEGNINIAFKSAFPLIIGNTTPYAMNQQLMQNMLKNQADKFSGWLLEKTTGKKFESKSQLLMNSKAEFIYHDGYLIYQFVNQTKYILSE